MKTRLIAVLIAPLFFAACSQEGDAPADTGLDNQPDTGVTMEGAAEVAATETAPAAGELTGDPGKGQRFYIFCQACHSINEGGINKVGPNLHGIVDAQAAQVEGFVYSEALSSSGITWDTEALDKWIESPAEMVPGTTMVFAGIRDPQQRADLIAFLKSASSQ